MIAPHHLNEWVSSGVTESIINLNVQSLEGSAAYDYLCYSDQLERINSGRLTTGTLNRYAHTEAGGWWCSGLDPLKGWGPMQWGCFKPNSPIRDRDGKLIKYEHPLKTETRAFFLRVSLEVWYQVAERSGVAMPETISIDEGEALGFWEWIQAHPDVPIILTEGAKKAGALLSIGYAAVALPGIYSGYRQPKDSGGAPIANPHLIPDLDVMAVKGRRFYFAFDNDFKRKTRANVSRAIIKTGYLLSLKECKSFVVGWSAFKEKGCDDLIATHGAEAFHRAFNGAINLATWQAKQFSELTYLPDLLREERFLSPFEFPTGTKIVCIKSPKGSGKTERLVEVVTEAIRNGQKVLVLTHRRQLGRALCNRFGIDYVEDKGTSETQGVLGYGLCVDSLHQYSMARFDPSGWGDALIIIDECEQVFWHLLSASTEIKQHRVTVLKNLKTLIQNVLSGTGKIFLSDADLSDISIDYVRGLAGYPINPWIVVNEQISAENWSVFSYRGTDPSRLVADLVQDIEAGGRPFVSCSAQKAKSKWGTRNLEAYFKKIFPEKQILRIDSESVSDPGHPAYGCIEKLNEILLEYDIVLASPSIETGVSIDIKGHFTGQWNIAQGVQPENSIRQSMARIRENVPRYLWAAERGITKIGNGATSIKSLLASQHKVTQSLIGLLTQSGFDEIDTNFQSESLNAWAKFACRINLGILSYREAILEGLRGEGHKIISGDDSDPYADPEAPEAVKLEVEATREKQYDLHKQAVSGQENPNDARLKQLRDKRNKTEGENLEQRHGELSRRYEVEITPDLVEKDDSGWYPRLRLHYYLTVGREYLSERDRASAEKQLLEGEGSLWKPDFNRSQWGGKVRLLEVLGIDRLFDPELELSDRSPILREIEQTAKSHAWAINSILNLTIDQKDSPVAVAQALLGKLDLKLEYLGRFGSRGDRQRLYAGALVSDDRFEIFNKWLERDQEAALAASQVKPAHSVAASLVSTPAINELGEEAVSGAEDEVRGVVDMLNLALEAESEGEGLEALQDMFQFCQPDLLSAATKLIIGKARERLSRWLQMRQEWAIAA